MHTGLTIITALFHVAIATHGLTKMIDVIICVIVLIAI